jgi:hypothetical protein
MGKCNSSSNGAQYETLQKYFWLLRLVIYFLSNLTHKTKIGPATKTGGRLLIANHLHQSNYLAIQHWVLAFAVPFTILSILCQNAGLKQFYRAKPTWLKTFHPISFFWATHSEHWWSCSKLYVSFPRLIHTEG